MVFTIPGARSTVIEQRTPQSRVSPTVIGLVGVQDENAVPGAVALAPGNTGIASIAVGVAGSGYVSPVVTANLVDTTETWTTEPDLSATVDSHGAINTYVVTNGGVASGTITPDNVEIVVTEGDASSVRPTAVAEQLYHLHSREAATTLFGSNSDIPQFIEDAETQDEVEFVVGAIKTALRGTARTTAYDNVIDKFRDVPTIFNSVTRLRRGCTVLAVAGHADAVEPTNLTDSSAANHVVASLESAAEAIGALVVVGVTQTTGAGVVTYHTNNKGARVFMLADGKSETASGTQPTAAFFISGVASEDEQYGIQHFWSDVPVHGITHPAQSWTQDEINSMITNGVNVLEVGRGGQWHCSTQYLSGAEPTSPFRFAHVRRVADEMQYQGDQHFDVVRHQVAIANDAGRTPTLGELVDSYQTLFDGYVSSGIIARVEVTDDNTTPTDLTNGVIRLQGEFEVRIGLQQVVFTLYFTTTLV